ncbi:cysteine hydrolase family protein [Opitutus terrae]|uniref:Isochorismatase hydrolase n=1 Tax=Opitutus terrae (strain DSM 11246 / JCM 15787 / PB90-1) TaxID=452637 RepID=B1ZQE6_OPITP|nr:cysteine hydrolase family protein [Opitutus terrae]ACB73626.1 isochorismatase hydrolase [Opitutus terrae PB90-1]
MKPILSALFATTLVPPGPAAATPIAPPTLLQLAGVRAAPGRLAESVVILIDLQRDYTAAGKLPLAGIAPALRETARLLERARAAGVPIIHIRQVSPRGRGLFETGTPGAEFASEVTPLAGEHVIEKRLPNAFAGTTLADTLAQLGRKELILAGAMTHMCVSATARSALDHGYHATVVADACATRDLPATDGGVIAAADVHRVALAELADRFATVVHTVENLPD